MRLLKGRELLNLGEVLALGVGHLLGEVLDGSGVGFFHLGDLELERLDFFDLLNGLLLALGRRSVEGLGLLGVLLEGQSLCGFKGLDLKLEVGDLLLQISVDFEELLDFNIK